MLAGAFSGDRGVRGVELSLLRSVKSTSSSDWLLSEDWHEDILRTLKIADNNRRTSASIQKCFLHHCELERQSIAILWNSIWWGDLRLLTRSCKPLELRAEPEVTFRSFKAHDHLIASVNDTSDSIKLSLIQCNLLCNRVHLGGLNNKHHDAKQGSSFVTF